MTPRGALICSLAMTIFIGLASTAEAFVYWGAPGDAVIERANLDATGLNSSFVTGVPNPYGLAVDAGHVYWADVGNGNIGRANIDGSGLDPTFVTGATDPIAVAVDDTYVYWANSGAHSIGRAPLADPNGAGKTQSFVGTGASSQPEGLAVNATHVYWSDLAGARIGRAPLANPSAPTLDLITGANNAHGVALDTSHLFWVDEGTAIGRANLDGTSPNAGFIDGLTQIPNDVEVDAAHVYWTNVDSDDASLGRIGRADIDGMNPDEGFIGIGSRPDGIAVDAGAPPAPPVLGGGTPSASTPSAETATGQRARAVRKCRKKFPPGPRRRRCLKRARKLPA